MLSFFVFCACSWVVAHKHSRFLSCHCVILSFYHNSTPFSKLRGLKGIRRLDACAGSWQGLSRFEVGSVFRAMFFWSSNALLVAAAGRVSNNLCVLTSGVWPFTLRQVAGGSKTCPGRCEWTPRLPQDVLQGLHDGPNTAPSEVKGAPYPRTHFGSQIPPTWFST